MNCIDEFIGRYLREYDYYYAVAKLAAQQCESLLVKSGVRAIVTYRAKNPGRLKSKIESRIKSRNYETCEDIEKDIVDLSGVRIALYFPGDRQEVDRCIKNGFVSVSEPKVFPEKQDDKNDKVFSGYFATHYRVRMCNDTLHEVDKRYANAVLEIQVASVLMHAWAEVEHDLIYKPFSGDLSDEERMVLDEVNGLVLVGELALKRLQRAISVRVSQDSSRFNNHYELASYLYSKLVQGEDDIDIGNVKFLLRFLKDIEYDEPGKIKKYVSEVGADKENGPVVDRLIDAIVSDNKELLEKLEQYKIKDEFPSNFVEMYSIPRQIDDNLMSRFIMTWVELEKVIRQYCLRVHKDTRRCFTPSGIYSLPIEENEKHAILRLREMRNRTIHGNSLYSMEEFKHGIDIMNSVIVSLKSKK